MNTDTTTEKITVSFVADRQTALARGIVLGERVEIAVGPEDLGGRWAEFVPHICFDGPAARCPLVVAGRTPADIIPALDKNAAALAQDRTRKAAELAENEAKIAEFERDGIRRHEQHSDGYVWERWEVAYMPNFGYVAAEVRPANAEERIAARKAVIEPLIAEHNAPHEAKAKEAHEAELARQAQEKAEREAKEAEAAKIKWAKRLETGIYELEIGSYNERRYGRPWGATVSLSGGKLVYDFAAATVTAQHGCGGIIQIPCKPGDVIAHGQKDLRRADRSENTLRLMAENGSCPVVDRTAAVRHLQA